MREPLSIGVEVPHEIRVFEGVSGSMVLFDVPPPSGMLESPVMLAEWVIGWKQVTRKPLLEVGSEQIGLE